MKNIENHCWSGWRDSTDFEIMCLDRSLSSFEMRTRRVFFSPFPPQKRHSERSEESEIAQTMASKQYFVYILASISKVLYIGVTNDLQRRVLEHKNQEAEGFTKKYKVKKLVYFEMTDDIYVALNREKQLKKWSRQKKIDLIESGNPSWKDLYHELFDHN